MDSTAVPSVARMSISREVLINLTYLLGVVGNLAALWILYRSSRTRNSKHVLMLRCLIINDLVAVLGMLSLLHIQKYDLFPVYWYCVFYVFMRAIGLGSGCVAFVMALERWLALTRPFVYQQLVTYQTLRRFIFALWSLALFVTALPFLGFGLYYQDGKCARYREATELTDKVYAYFFMAFGTTLCTLIALCNLTVIWVVAKLGKRNRVLVRRVSRSIISNRVESYTKYATPEEIAFAKFMAVICVIFIVCWMPQMISIPLAQNFPESKICKSFARIADMLMGVYFTLDPYIYVLYRYMEKFRVSFRYGCCVQRSHSPANMPTPPTVTGTPTSVLLQPPPYQLQTNDS